LAKQRGTVGQSPIFRFLRHLKLTFKKSLHAAEQDRPDNATERRALRGPRHSGKSATISILWRIRCDPPGCFHPTVPALFGEPRISGNRGPRCDLGCGSLSAPAAHSDVASAQHVDTSLDAIDFLVDAPDLIGKTVTVSGCSFGSADSSSVVGSLATMCKGPAPGA
jgi:hypothetical protein